MAETIRFGVSLNSKLLDGFDKIINSRGYSNRSEAIRDLIRDKIVENEWKGGNDETVGTINIVYDHHTRVLQKVLTELQHNYHKHIISTTHVHMDHDNCLEIIVVRGKPLKIKEIADRIISTKGVKFGKMTVATTGKKII